MEYQYQRYPLMLYRIASVNNDGTLNREEITVQNSNEESEAIKNGWRPLDQLIEPKIEVWLLTVLKRFFDKWGWLYTYFGGIITGVALMVIKDVFFSN